MLRLRANIQLLRPQTIRSNLFATVSYYDSQSGIQVTRRSSDFSLHCTSTGVRTCTTTNETTTFIPVTSLKDLRSTDEHVGGVSLEIPMTTFLEQRATLVELIKASKARDLLVRTTLLETFSCSPVDVQLAAGVIADANADVICLCDRDGCLQNGDTEEAVDVMQEILEAVTWLDVEGTPIVDRLALRLGGKKSKKSSSMEQQLELLRMVVMGGDDEMGIVLPVIREFDIDDHDMYNGFTSKNVLLVLTQAGVFGKNLKNSES